MAVNREAAQGAVEPRSGAVWEDEAGQKESPQSFLERFLERAKRAKREKTSKIVGFPA